MKWFDGNIPSAIQQAKAKHAIFIVYVSGKDAMSQQMDATWEDQSVGNVCDANNAVALRLEANSETCAQFCMIYPVVCVPCTYFIGENGVPLEVTGGSVSADEFVTKFEQVLKMHKDQLSGQVASSGSSQGAASATATTPDEATPAGGAEVAMATEESPALAAGSPGTSADKPNLEDRVKTAKEKLQQKQSEKAAKEAQEKIQKEKERIQLGKEMKKLQDFKEEQARKEMMDEWKKEKEEKKREKERIREQLARDREEKAAKFYAQKQEREELEKAKAEAEAKQNQATVDQSLRNNDETVANQLASLRSDQSEVFHSEKDEKECKIALRRSLREEREEKEAAHKVACEEQLVRDLARTREEKAERFRSEKAAREKQTQEAKKIKLEAAEQAQQREDTAKMERARLQFRLPDGSVLSNQFSSSDPLQAARDFLIQNVGSTYGNFSLSMLYPKRDFTDADLSQSMLDLGLAPSAVVIVLPGSRSSVSRAGPSTGTDSGLLTLLFAPFLALWSFMRYMFISSPPSGGPGRGSGDGHQGAAAAQPAGGASQGARPKSSYGLRSRQGNVTRLSNLRDDDDEDRTTWNGNSTQQM